MSAATGEQMTALCCECGRVRTVSPRYNGPTGRFAAGEAWRADQLARVQQRHGRYMEHQPGWRCLIELKCDTCKVRTAHAYLRDGEHRDYAERVNEQIDRKRRQVARRIAGLEGTGVRVLYRDADELKVEGAPVEVVEYDDLGFEVRVCLTANPTQLLACLVDVEEYVDDHDQLGDWQTSRVRRWRGVALKGRSYR